MRDHVGATQRQPDKVHEMHKIRGGGSYKLYFKAGIV